MLRRPVTQAATEPACIPEVGKVGSNELNPHVSDLRLYQRSHWAYGKLAGQTMIICVRGGT